VQAEFELRQYFQGRRSGGRMDHRVDLVLKGEGARFRARAVNLSRSGVLLRILGRRASDDLVDFAGRVSRVFARGARLHFLDIDLTVKADIVRVTFGDGGLSDEMLIAWRFRRPLAKTICKDLGLPTAPVRS